MLLTIILAATFIGLLFASMSLYLRLGLRWAKAPGVTMRRVFVAIGMLIVVVMCSLGFLFVLGLSHFDASPTLLVVVELAAAVIVPCVVIMTAFKIRFWRALQAWLSTLLATVATLVVALVVLRPLLLEAFIIPTNSMAPTLIGEHWQGVCPKCGRPSYCSPGDAQYGVDFPTLMICENFHVTEATDIDKTVHRGDRIISAKFLAPRTMGPHRLPSS